MKSIKPETIERQVKYSSKPYSEIIENAIKKGWLIKRDEKEIIEGQECRTVKIHNEWNQSFETCYPLNNPLAAHYNIYTGW